MLNTLGCADTDLGSFSDVDSENRVDIAIIGDVPYGNDALLRFPDLVNSITDDDSIQTIIHVGDIKSGDSECTDEWYREILRLFNTFVDSLIYTIGDNEWADCHRPNNGSYNPIERLNTLRDIFFDVPGTTMGQRRKIVEAQDGYPENQLWKEARVVFATLHVVGSNNDLSTWFDGLETPEQTAARLTEFSNRNAANIAWIQHAFDVASSEDAAGVALFFHADMWKPDDRITGASFIGFDETVRKLGVVAEIFGKPVLLVSGDNHKFREDFGVTWFSEYSVDPVANVTQIIVNRSIEGQPGQIPTNIEWLRLTIDSHTEEVFSWEEVVIN